MIALKCLFNILLQVVSCFCRSPNSLEVLMFDLEKEFTREFRGILLPLATGRKWKLAICSVRLKFSILESDLFNRLALGNSTRKRQRVFRSASGDEKTRNFLCATNGPLTTTPSAILWRVPQTYGRAACNPVGHLFYFFVLLLLSLE